MNFDLMAPCADCPFRTDKPAYLTALRAEEIADTITRRDLSFSCHKTVDYSSGGGTRTESTQHCAGAMILLEKLQRPNQVMRIAERLRIYDHKKLRMDAPVFDTAEEFIEAHDL